MSADCEGKLLSFVKKPGGDATAEEIAEFLIISFILRLTKNHLARDQTILSAYA